MKGVEVMKQLVCGEMDDFFFNFFWGDIFFITFFLFPGLPFGNPLSHSPPPASMRVLPHPPTPFFLPWHSPTLGL
jgi:hypothetical protein